MRAPINSNKVPLSSGEPVLNVPPPEKMTGQDGANRIQSLIVGIDGVHKDVVKPGLIRHSKIGRDQPLGRGPTINKLFKLQLNSCGARVFKCSKNVIWIHRYCVDSPYTGY